MTTPSALPLIAAVRFTGWFPILAVLAVTFLRPYVRGPYRLYRKGSHPLHAGWSEHTGDARSQFPDSQFLDLENLGFTLAGYLVKGETTARVGYIALFVHKENRDIAEVVVLPNGRILDLPIFKSRFGDGLTFEVAGLRNLPHRLSGGPNFPAFNFPYVESTGDLYQIHRKIKKQFLASRSPVISEGKDELIDRARRAEEVHRFKMSCRYYKLAPTGDKYVYTIVGAVQGIWKHLWPFDPIRRGYAVWASKKYAAELAKTTN
jgi:hypothetical protein